MQTRTVRSFGLFGVRGEAWGCGVRVLSIKWAVHKTGVIHDTSTLVNIPIESRHKHVETMRQKYLGRIFRIWDVSAAERLQTKLLSISCLGFIE